MQRWHIDLPLLFGLLILCSVGLMALYSASGADIEAVYRQSLRVFFGIIGMCLIAQLSLTQFARWALPLYIAGVLLLVLVLFFGDVGKGAQRWLDLRLLRFQPSEFMKLALPMAIAWYLSGKALPPSLWQLFIAGILIILPVLLITKQPDLGSALLVAAIGFSVLFIAGMSWRTLIVLTGAAIACIPAAWYLMHDYQRQRVLTFVNPDQDPLNAGYHTIQSQIAVGSGGFYGKGWLNGTQSQLEFLPERSTDFIFAVFCEEFGLLGALLLLCIYLFLILRGGYIAIKTQQHFGKLLGAALVLSFSIQIFVNIGMVLGQLPVVGVPLPLVSMGGTSMLVTLLGFGVLMAISAHRPFRFS